MAKNRFDEACDVHELVHQIIGAASMCWEDLTDAGVFDSTEAALVADDGLARLAELITQSGLR